MNTLIEQFSEQYRIGRVECITPQPNGDYVVLYVMVFFVALERLQKDKIAFKNASAYEVTFSTATLTAYAARSEQS